jgi:hypothetical protein
MDIHKAVEIEELTDNLVTLSEKYAGCRLKAANNKFKLEAVLASKLPEIREKKPSVGIEMAILMLIETAEPEVKEYYRDMLRYEAEYKGLEHIMEAVKSKIMFAQSLMKYQKEGEVYGE